MTHKQKLMFGSARNFAAMIAVKAENASGGDPKVILEELQKAQAAFQESHDQQIADLAKKIDDPVQAEKVEKINASVIALQKALDKAVGDIAALKVGGPGGETDPLAAVRAEHAAAFEAWFRRGPDGGRLDAVASLEVKAELSTDSKPDGGFLTPTTMETTIDSTLRDTSAMRRLARVTTMSGKAFEKLVNVHGTASGWVGEKSARPQTDASKLEKLEYEAMEIYAEPAATQALLDDASINIEQWIADEVSMEFAEQEGDAFINGDGTNKPRGLLTYPIVDMSAGRSAWEWGKIGYVKTGAAAGFAASDPADAFISLIYAIRRGYRVGATWLMNDLVTAEVRKFKDGQGNYLWQPSTVAGQPAAFLGYPHEADDFMPDTGANALPVAFGNFQRGYVIADRTGIRVLRDPFTAKPYVLFYTTKRVAGGVQNFQAIGLLRCEA